MKKNLHEKFNNWLSTETGREVLNIEVKAVKKLKYGKSANCMVVIGAAEQQAFLTSSPAKQSLLVTPDISSTNKTCHCIVAHPDEIPLLPCSVDFILLPHTLDFSKRTSHILREANICLQPEGYMVVLGFNPYSLWGLRRIFSMRFKVPWCGNFHSIWHIKDLLTLLNYEVVLTKRFLYRPHAKRFGLFKKLAFLEAFFRVLLPFSGAVYMLVAKKRVYGVTPLRLKWHEVPKVLKNSAITTPTTTLAEQEQHKI